MATLIEILVIQQSSTSGSLHQEECQYSLPELQKHHYNETRRKEGRKEGRAFVARLNCQISFSLKDKKKHILVTNIHTFWHLGLVCILLLEAIISLAGKKILLFDCVFLFLCFPSPGLSSGVASPMHTNKIHTAPHLVTQFPHGRAPL